MYSTSLLYGLDNAIVADIQAATVATFGDVEKLSWIGIGFPLRSIAVTLMMYAPNLNPLIEHLGL